MPQIATEAPKTTILELDRDHDDWTPTDILNEVKAEHDWVTLEYVEGILRDFTLGNGDQPDILGKLTADAGADPEPDEADADEDDGDHITYECSLCGETFPSAPAVKAHVTQKSDAKHRDRHGSDPGVVTTHGEDELVEINKGLDHEPDKADTLAASSALTERDYDVIRVVAEHPDWYQREVGQEVFPDVSENSSQAMVSQTFRKFDLGWEGREEIAKRCFPHIAAGDPEPDAEVYDDTEVWVDRGRAAVERLPDHATLDDVEIDATYIGTVNGVEHYGAFVSLNTGDPRDVSGLMHYTNMGDREPSDFSVGDVVLAQVDHVQNAGPALVFVGDATDDHLDEFDVPRYDLVRHPDARDRRDANRGAEQTRLRAGRATYEGPETGLDLTSGLPAQTIKDRPVKSTATAAAEDADETTELIALTMTHDEVFDVVSGEPSEEIRRKLFDLATGQDDAA